MPKLMNTPLADLLDQRAQIEREIETAIKDERVKLESRIEELSAMLIRDANSFGVGRESNVTRRLHRKIRRQKRVSTPKRVNPLKGVKKPIKYIGPAGERWSGFGHTPVWLRELEAKGTSRDKFLKPQRKAK